MTDTMASPTQVTQARPVNLATPRGPIGSARVAPILRGLGGFVLWLGLWQLLTTTGPLADTRGLPTALGTLQSASGLVGDSAFWSAVGTTFKDALAAMAIVIVLGTSVGVAMGLWRPVEWLLEPSSQFLRPIPAVVLLPLVLLVYGPTSELAVALAVLGGVWPVLIHAQIGVRSVDPVALDTGRAMGLPWHMRQTAIVLPSALPSFVTGVRIASSLTLMLVIGAGVLGGSPGLGQTIMLAQQTGDAERVFAILLWAGVLGVALNGLLSAIEKRLNRGRRELVS